jgi:hypothetical protein
VKARDMALKVPKPPAVKSAATGRFEQGKGDKLLEAHRKQNATEPTAKG